MKDVKAVIEFGTSKISCIVAEGKQRNNVEVLGYAQSPYAGIKNANWVEPKEVVAAIEQAVDSAERQIGSRIRKVDVGIPGAFLQTEYEKIQIQVNGHVEDADIDRLMDRAREFELSEDLELVHEWPAWFMLDDENIYLDPYNVSTTRLRGCVVHTLANRYFLDDVSELLRHIGIGVNSFIPEPIAQALYLLPQDKRDETAVLVDIGYYSTNISVVYGDSILFFDVIPMGGGHITNDIAYAMKVDFETAEQLKRRYTFGLSDNSTITQMFTKATDGKLKKFPYDLLKEIIDSRVEHIILSVCKVLSQVEARLGKKVSLYMTGGGILFMKGMDSYFRTIAGRMPSVVKVASVRLAEPDAHAAFALALYACDGYVQSMPPEKQGFFGKLLG